MRGPGRPSLSIREKRNGNGWELGRQIKGHEIVDYLAAFFNGVGLIPLRAATVGANGRDAERLAEPLALLFDLLCQFSRWSADERDRALARLQRALVHHVEQHRPDESSSFPRP